jgi:hypothetical protein
MKPHEEKLWIESLAQTLRQHQEPYKEGAWEQFSASSKPIVSMHHRLRWLYATAAACLLFAIGVMLWPSNPKLPSQEWAATGHNTPIVPPIGRVTTPAQSDMPAVLKSSSSSESIVTGVIQPTQLSPAHRSISAHEQIARVDFTDIRPSVRAEQSIQQELRLSPRLSESGLKAIEQHAWGDPLLEDWDENNSNQLAMQTSAGYEEEASKKWNLGLELSPSVTNAQLNMGGGLNVGYQISEHVAIRSGLSVARFGFNKGGHVPAEAVSMQLPAQETQPMYSGIVSDKSLVLSNNYQEIAAIQSQIWAMDIPVEIEVQVAKQFYTSVGLSLMTVLDENRTNYFLDRIQVSSQTDLSRPSEELRSNIRAQYASQEDTNPALAQQGIAGFFNLSIGRSFQLSPKMNASVEPFFKLPLQKSNRSDLNMTNGGVKLKFGF